MFKRPLKLLIVSTFVLSLVLGTSVVVNAKQDKPLKEYFDSSDSKLLTEDVEKSIRSTLTEEEIDFYKYVQSVKNQNKNLSTKELVEIIDWTKLEKAHEKGRQLRIEKSKAQ